MATVYAVIVICYLTLLFAVFPSPAYAGKLKSVKSKKLKLSKKNNSLNEKFKNIDRYKNLIKANGLNIGSIDLRTALKLALKYYPGIQSSKYSYVASIYNKNESLYNYYPQISANALYSKNSVMSVSSLSSYTPSPSFMNNGGINYSLNTYSANLNTTWLLYSFGSRRYSFMQSFYGMKVSKYAYGQEINTDLYSVILNFAQYFQDKEIEKADNENLKNNETTYKAAEAFYRVGTGDLLDAESAKANMETAKAAYINSKFNSKIAKLALINSIGLPLNKNYNFINTMEMKIFKKNLETLIKLGLKYNPALKENWFTVKSGKASVKEAATAYYPNLNADFNYTGENSVFPLNRNYNVGITLNIPIFNGFLTKNKVEYSKASLYSAVWSKKLAENNLIYTVSQDYYAIKNQYLTVKALKQSEISSKLAYTLALKSYEVGVGSMVQLVTANAQYISALTSYINGEYSYFYLKAKLYSDIGLMLEHYIKKLRWKNVEK